MVKINSGVDKWAEAVGVKGSCHVEDSENIAYVVFAETFLLKADFYKL